MSERPADRSPEDDESAPAGADPAPVGDVQDPTVGTGSSLGVGCMVLMLVIVVVLAAVFFLPYFRR